MNARRFSLLAFGLLALLLELVLFVSVRAAIAQDQYTVASASLAGDQSQQRDTLPSPVLDVPLGDVMMNEGYPSTLGSGSGAQAPMTDTDTPTAIGSPFPVCTQPTSTPYPTPTDYPTPGQAATCPYPFTQTPYPTATRYPCPECPTSTATPTYTPSNTPTDTATATPTSTPTNTPTNTPTPFGCILQTLTPNPTYTERPPPSPTPTGTACEVWPT
ncbi:MAG TPA: hypothetical protein VLQ48_04030, partial [Chloroflexia bacterium]|nr:hypothetical protein [Chloroflexia bacterium]